MQKVKIKGAYTLFILFEIKRKIALESVSFFCSIKNVF